MSRAARVDRLLRLDKVLGAEGYPGRGGRGAAAGLGAAEVERGATAGPELARLEAERRLPVLARVDRRQGVWDRRDARARPVGPRAAAGRRRCCSLRPRDGHEHRHTHNGPF